MSRRDDDILLMDMLAHAQLATAAAQPRLRHDLDADPIFRAALERFIEIIGEAASRVSDGLKRRMPAVPWLDIVGMRNRIVHGYAEVDRDLIWVTVNDDLPKLITELETVITQADDADP